MSTFPVLEAYTMLRRELGLMRAAELSSADFGHNQMIILYRVAQSPTSMSEIAEYSASDPAAITRAVKSLEDAGLVKRKADPKDQRRSIVELTSKGRLRAAKALEIRDRIGTCVNNTLSENEQQQLTALINKVVSGLQAHRP